VERTRNSKPTINSNKDAQRATSTQGICRVSFRLIDSQATQTQPTIIMAPTSRLTKMENVDEDSMDVEQTWVRLKTGDGKRFTLSKSEASCSNALRTMIESYQNVPNASAEYINLQSVNSNMLTKVIEWCRVHCNDHSNNVDATCSRKSEVHITDWDRAFLNALSEEELFKLIHVANYLDVSSLFESACHIVAKRVEEIRHIYELESDFSPGEEHQILPENSRQCNSYVETSYN